MVDNKKSIDWNKPEDREMLWHSASHIMAAAIQEVFPKAQFAIGPPIDNGFYYDIDIGRPLTPDDLKQIEQLMRKIIKQKEKFERKEISRQDALELFKENPYKKELIEELPTGEKISIYTTGKFVDLCRGPHVADSSAVGAVKLMKVSGAYWRGSEKNKMLQRIYGIAFPTQQQLDTHLKLLEEAEKRNHIKLGRELDLFSMHDESPGCPFFHAKGMVLWNELMKLWREKHAKAGYVEVSTPLILRKYLWEMSGHWDHYKNNMYFTKIDDEDYAVKPMNCPGGILIYQAKRHSYRDFPIRMAEVGVVHRHELSGVLNGLFRVRKFTQDDAHIFCLPEQINDEVSGVIDLVDGFYKVFGFTYHVELSTMPENAMGSKEMWDKAEKALEEALKKNKMDYKINPGDGAFYGPKIDFHIKDSLGRTWQCATIQLDFSMPEKFDLFYIDKEDKQLRPVMIHRVIYGSLERFIGILIEHYGGSFPVWLAPTQVKVIAVSDSFNDYAKAVHDRLIDACIRSELDLRSETVSKKVRDAQLQKVPYVINVGEKETSSGSVAVRDRSGKIAVEKLDEFVERICGELAGRK